MESQPRPEEAAQTLQLYAKSRAAIADRLVTPWWYHPILGVLCAEVIAVQAAHSHTLTALGLSFFAIGIAILTSAYRRMTGIWVTGFQERGAIVWAAALGATGAVAFVAAIALDRLLDWRAAPVVLGIAVIPVVVFLGRAYDAALRAQLRGEGKEPAGESPQSRDGGAQPRDGNA